MEGALLTEQDVNHPKPAKRARTSFTADQLQVDMAIHLQFLKLFPRPQRKQTWSKLNRSPCCLRILFNKGPTLFKRSNSMRISVHTYCPKMSWSAESSHSRFVSLGSFGFDIKLGHSAVPSSTSLRQTFHMQWQQKMAVWRLGTRLCCHLSESCEVFKPQGFRAGRNRTAWDRNPMVDAIVKG